MLSALVLHSFADEMLKLSESTLPYFAEKLPTALKTIKSVPQSAHGFAGRAGQLLGEESALGRHLMNHGEAYDLAGLGVLALPPADTIQHQLRKDDTDPWEVAHAGAELGGLGVLALPSAAKLIMERKLRGGTV